MSRVVILILSVSSIVAFAYHTHNEQEKNPVVTSPLGPIRGKLLESRLGKTIYAFRGIRYAKPPIGELRFKPPEPIEPYTGEYDATEDKPMCPQPSTYPVDENCLTLNVYSTKLPHKNERVKRPVIVHIHPGGFWGAGSASYVAGPQYFMDQDIVLVTFNYRLGTLGFLATGDKHSPGNNGLKDQVQVLRWVHQNIETFGGDKESVTLLGYSAGSISVILHMVSPMSKGLFHKAICLSGSLIAQWLIGTHQISLAKRQAKFVGCPSERTSEEMVKCLKTVPYDKLGNSLKDFFEFGNNPVLLWIPVVEPDFGQERFLIDQPIKLIQQRKFHQIPFIAGVTSRELEYKAFEFLENSTLTEELEKKWETIAPIIFQYERDTEISKNASRGLRNAFLKNRPIANNSETEKGLREIFAGAMVGFGSNRAIKLLSRYSSQPVYYYKFSYEGTYSHYYTSASNFTKPIGPVHHDDLIYLFYISTLFPKFQATKPVEVDMVAKYTKLLSNFASFGNPTPQLSKEFDDVTWEQFTNDNLKYLDIGKTLVMKEKLLEERYNVWDKLFPLEHYTQHDITNGYLA